MAAAPDPISGKNVSQLISCSSTPSPSSSLPSLTSCSSPDHPLLQVIVDEVFTADKMANDGSESPEMETRKRKREMEETVQWLRDVALNPVDPNFVIRKCEMAVLKMRRHIFLNLEEVANLEDLPNFASLRRKKKARHIPDEQYKRKRRSERIAKNIKLPTSHLVVLRKRIGIGDTFQADVPDWSGPPSNEDRSNYRNTTSNPRYLGMELWPQRPVIAPNVQNQNVLPHLSDKLMPNHCQCIRPGGVECIRCHVDVARNQLKSELGQAFQTLGFELMGEEVGNFFTHEHRMLFDALERGIMPLSGPKGFWSIASRHLRTKESRHLVSYFFNVYLLRRVGNQSRSGPVSLIDSDEDIDDDEDEEQAYDGGQVQASSQVSSDRMQLRKKSL